MYLPLGTLVGYLVGGWVNQFFGWRETFMVLGIPGVILALLLFFVLREPPRGFSENRSVSGPSPSLWSTIRYFMSVPSLRLLPLAGAVHGIGAWGAQLWLPAYFTRVHHMSSGEIGTWFALIFGLGVPRAPILLDGLSTVLCNVPVTAAGICGFPDWLFCPVCRSTFSSISIRVRCRRCSR